MKFFRTSIAALAFCLMVVMPTAADTLWDYQAINADGTGSHPMVNAPAVDSNEEIIESNKVTVEGVALSGMNDLWSGSVMYALFIQDETSDRGGMEIWAGSFWWPSGGWMPEQYAPFNAGDRVRVTGFLGNHKGKVLINDRHTNSLGICPVVEKIGHPGLPNPELIPSLADCNHFDVSRKNGGERYQTRFTMLHGVEITAGQWTGNSSITISDATGNGTLYIPPMVNLSGRPMPMGKFSVVGIYDQEDDGSGTPTVYHNEYRMILRNAADIAASLTACREVRSRSVGDQIALANKIVSRIYDGKFFVQDVDRAGGVEVISDRLVTVGDVVSIMGSVVLSDGSKAISAKYVASSRNSAAPVLVNGKTLRGQGGLDVFGLLVRCVGRIGNNLGGSLYQFTTDDGGSITLNSGGYNVPAAGAQVTVTAVASGSASAPVLLLSGEKDIVALVP